jgi:phosphatidylglycerol:prolipoprotein diacylglycerol transferase
MVGLSCGWYHYCSMAPELGRIGPIVIRTYTLLLDFAVVFGVAWLAWRGWRSEQRPAAWMDVGLGAIVGGIVTGRLGHVGVHWVYFSSHLEEIYQVWRGGIDWHTAFLGALAASVLICQYRKVSFFAVLDALAIVLPISAIFIYAGCLMVSCGHGREVASLANYPPLIALELPDLYGVVLPRLASQLYGLLWAVIVLALYHFFFSRWNMPPGIRFWLILALLALGAFAIGFSRGDSVPMIGVLRLDQVLDLLIAVVAGIGAMLTPRPGHSYALYGPSGFVRR